MAFKLYKTKFSQLLLRTESALQMQRKIKRKQKRHFTLYCEPDIGVRTFDSTC